MKNLASITEGVWIEINHVTLTEEQKTILKSSNEEEKNSLIEQIKEDSETTPDEITLALAIATYNYLKPVILSETTYEFISCDMTFRDTKAAGILNCRVNGEHKQIRF